MAVTAYWYSAAFLAAFNKEIDFVTDTVKVALTTNSYTPNQDTHNYFDDVTNEITGTGYTAGGVALGSKTLANANNVITLDAADAQWLTSTLTARRAVIYESTGTPSTSALLLWIDFGADFSSSSGTFQITFSASGIAIVTATDATGFP